MHFHYNKNNIPNGKGSTSSRHHEGGGGNISRTGKRRLTRHRGFSVVLSNGLSVAVALSDG